MSPSPQPKALRVGFIQGGRIIEERNFRRRERVTVGPDARSTLVLPSAQHTGSWGLFEPIAGRWHLAFTEAMEGRVQVGGQGLTLAQVRERGLARVQGDGFLLPLDETSRGRLVLGGVMLLFQLVATEQTRVELPPEIRGTLLSRFDRLFLAVLATSVALHLTCGAGLLLAEPPPERELALEELPDRFATLLLTPRPAETPKAPATEAAAQEKDAPDGKKDEAAEQEETAAPAADPASPEQQAAARQRVANLGLLGALKASGGSVADVLGGGDTLATDFASALRGVSGVKPVAATEAVDRGPRGGGTGRVAGIGDLATQAPARVELTEKQDVEVRGRVSEAVPEVGGDDVDRAALSRYVKARLRAIQACYERELKRNPKLQGKLLVRFTIGPSGRTTEVDLEEDTLGSPTVGQCVQALIRTWTFPFQPTSEVPVTYPFVFAPAS